ncbi:ComF family protein [Holdemanella biformis]|uniref:ComF family protein n=1 Tax=Holdemanella biformis TaxID=1735 RepID=UPI0022DEBCF3|nr:phosphoribosyltransferase family protein [Holdemanella biformis]
MWKWTDPDNIKAIILDVDSLDEAYLSFPYIQYIPDVQLFLVQDENNTHDKEVEVKKYYDITNLLQDILADSNCDSTSIISISNNPLFLKDMMRYHIGTILTHNLAKDFLRNTPDFTACTINMLPKILKGEVSGYAAEVYATYGKTVPQMRLLKIENEISLSNGTNREVIVFIGGRYYSEKHHYLLNDPLSFDVLNFKRYYTYSVDLFFDAALYSLRKRESIDALTYIPLKPGESKYDRFVGLKLEKNSIDGMKLQQILEFKKSFSQKGNNLSMRKENVKGAFNVISDVKDKNIIIIDDVYSTGSTIEEAIKTLYENGANKVFAILLAVNQMTESNIKYQNLKCRLCGKEMKLKMSKDGKLFFGCSAYNQHKELPPTIDLKHGLKSLKDKNKLEVTTVRDLEDEY